MKIWIYMLSFLIIVSASIAYSQNSNNFYQDILISDEIKLKEQIDSVQDSARDILNKKAQKLKIDTPKLPQRKKTEAPKLTAAENLSNAPFGLLWGGTMADITNIGVILTKIEEKDYINSFSATHLPKPIRDFRQVDLTFGEENELWRIISYGKFLDDNASADLILREYRQYYKLLSQKYGNAKEFYTPKMVTYEKKVKNQYGEEEIETEQRPDPIGSPTFLADLESGEATLYATFEGKEVGAALAVNVDGNGKSYIIIDYKNIKILKARENQTLDAL